MFNSRREAPLDSLSFLIIDLSGLQSMDMLATKKNSISVRWPRYVELNFYSFSKQKTRKNKNHIPQLVKLNIPSFAKELTTLHSGQQTWFAGKSIIYILKIIYI
jgi:hypothetical protein